MAIRLGRGRGSVTIEGALADDLTAQIKELLGPVFDEMEREADAALADIKATWPVDEGTSLAAWHKELRLHPDSFKVEIALVNSAPHTRYIKSTKVGEKVAATRLRSPLSDARKRASAARRALKKSLPGVIERALREGGLGG